ncbi:hypothetical protein AB8880_09555 [Alphaproteobacteria bacterium LSUCC0684]
MSSGRVRESRSRQDCPGDGIRAVPDRPRAGEARKTTLFSTTACPVLLHHGLPRPNCLGWFV